MIIDRETAPARLRARYMLFGVIVASAASSIATHYALCDRDGSPACGNIGQAGSPLPPPALPAAAAPPVAAPLTVTVVAQTAPLVEISISQQLVAPRVNTPVAQTAQPVVDPLVDPDIEPVVARPLTDERGDFMPGNVMTKGGRRH